VRQGSRSCPFVLVVAVVLLLDSEDEEEDEYDGVLRLGRHRT